jgi:hypothetical protein
LVHYRRWAKARAKPLQQKEVRNVTFRPSFLVGEVPRTLRSLTWMSS